MPLDTTLFVPVCLNCISCNSKWWFLSLVRSHVCACISRDCPCWASVAGSRATRCCFTSVANHNASQPSAYLPGTPAGLHPACWAALPLGENSHLQIKHNPKHGDVLSKQRLPVLSPKACPHHPDLTPQAAFVLSTCSSLWLNASIPTLDKSELTEILPAAHLPHVKALVYSLPIVGLCKWCSVNRRQVHVMLWFKYLMKKLRLFASSLPRCSLGE